MKRTEFIERFRKHCERLAITVEQKNADYSGNGDPFQNFRAVAKLTDGAISSESGIYVRMTDKMARLWNLMDQEPNVLSESFEDTAMDLAAYAILLVLLREDQVS